jgi:membrane protease YdiL (CAAX protease family)
LVWFKYRSEATRILGLRRPDLLHLFIVVLFVWPLWVVGSGMGDLIDYLIPIPWDIQGEAIKKLATTGLLSIVVAGSFFPAVGEEIFFRGFLGRGLVARYGVVAGVLLTSLAFGLFHFTPSQIAGTFVIGLGFHTVFLTTKALPAAMLLHFLINCQGLMILSRQPAQNDPPIPNVASFSGFEPYLAFLAIPTVGLLGLILYRLRTRWQFTSEKPSPMTYVSGETPPVPAVAIRDSLVQHWRLAAVAVIVWSCFAVGFLRSPVLDL